MDNSLWCLLHGIAVYQVGDLYDTDESGAPISDADRSKWFVSVLAGSFPEDIVRTIPLADTKSAAEMNAVDYLWSHTCLESGSGGQAAIQ